MPIVAGASWGIITIVVMYMTIKYYLPILIETRPSVASKVQEQLDLQDEVQKNLSSIVVNIRERNKIITTTRKNGILLICGGVFAVVCGYYAGASATSWISFLKMTLTFVVLASACITDYEFLLIPNLCPIVLICGRFVIAILEFIFMKDEAILWFGNSVIALIITLIFMLLMSKITKGGIGMGDVKLFTGVGFVCGIQAVCFTLMIAFFICAVLSLGLLLTSKKGLKDALPMGPFIWIGFGITIILRIV